MKKNLFFILLLVVFAKQAHTQIIAGDSVSSNVLYQRLDSFLLLPYHSCYDINTTIDVTNDGIGDIKFVYGNCASPSSSDNHFYAIIQNHTIEIAVNNAHVLWPDTISLHSIINSNHLWKDTVAWFTLKNSGYYLGSMGPTSYSSGYFSGNACYLGFRIKENTDTIYGWFLLGVSGANSLPGLVIKSYAKGVSTVGVNESYTTDEDIKLYPMPTANLLYLTSKRFQFPKEDIPIIYDISGKQYTIPLQYINKNTYKLDVNGLLAGMYVIAIKTENGVVRKKMIVEK